MTTNNSLIASYFSFFYSHRYGYEKKKELFSNHQAVILANRPNPLITSMTRYILQISLLLGLFCASCTKEGPGGNNPPVLTYEGLIANSLNQGLGKDSVSIRLSFVDVDGDIGGVNELNIFIIDNRDGSEYIVRSFPELPNNGKLLEGTMKLTLPSTCCIYPPEAMTPACDKNPLYPENRFTVDVYIEDLARNRSNAITTDTITMFCLRN